MNRSGCYSESAYFSVSAQSRFRVMDRNMDCERQKAWGVVWKREAKTYADGEKSDRLIDLSEWGDIDGLVPCEPSQVESSLGPVFTGTMASTRTYR